MILRDDKNRSITKLYKTLLYSYLFNYLLYKYSKCFVQLVAQPVVQPAAKYKRTCSCIIKNRFVLLRNDEYRNQNMFVAKS